MPRKKISLISENNKKTTIYLLLLYNILYILHFTYKVLLYFYKIILIFNINKHVREFKSEKCIINARAHFLN